MTEINNQEVKDAQASLEKVAVRIKQFDRELFVFSISASEISGLIRSGKMDIDRWSQENNEGYQRIPTESRYKKYGKYVGADKGITPVSLLISLRERRALEIEEMKSGTVKLKIDLKNTKLYIPDGQHRAYGLDWALDHYTGIVDDYQVPVVLFQADGTDSRYEEAQQFFTINSTAKRVKTDLAQRYLLRAREKELGELEKSTPLPGDATLKELESYGVKIADLLNANGTLKGKIEPPNTSSASASISQSSFIESIKPFLGFASEAGWDIEKVVDAINAFWSAIRAKCPESFNHWNGDSCPSDDENHYNSVLVTTTGMFSLNGILKRMMTLPEVLARPTSPEVYKKIFDKRSMTDEFLTDGKDGFWSSESSIDGNASSRGTSRKSFKELENDIWDAIKER